MFLRGRGGLAYGDFVEGLQKGGADYWLVLQGLDRAQLQSWGDIVEFAFSIKHTTLKICVILRIHE